jgi:ABC-type branched-subunit amino acid transport system ATPase component
MSPVIEVRQLHKRYGDTVAVDEISFTVAEGEIFGILGPNGAGKTTTVECIEGLRAPDRGTVSVLGLHPGRDRAELTQRLGVQLQDSQLPDKLRVDEALELYSSFYRNPAGWRALIDVLGLAGKTRTRFGKLSGGQKQRLSIALALVGTPQVIGALLFYAMMFFAGLWLPIPNMPATLQHISHATPLGAAVPALTVAAGGSWPAALQLLTMAGWAVVFGLAAARFFRWE